MTAASETSSPFTTTVEAPESWKRVIRVEIDRTHFDGEYARNLRKARKDYERPGFRKGKVPMTVVEKELGGEVRMTTLEEIMPRAYQAAVVEHGFWPVSDPGLEDLKMDEGEPVSLALAVEVRPEVEAKDYDDLSLTSREAALEEGAVDKALERLRESRAVWETVDRASETGDQLIVDITPHDDAGEPDPEKKVEGYQFEAGNENNFDAFNEALDGAAAGDEREASVVYPDDYATEELRGKSMTYGLVVKEVKAKTLPEIDDAFASSMKEGQTLLEMRKGLHDELMTEETRRVEREGRDEIVAKLMERNPVELPPSMVEDYLDSSVEEMKQRARMYGQEMNDEQVAGYRESAKPDAERTLGAMFVLESIRKLESIEVSDEDVDERIAEIAAENGFPADQYKEYVDKNDERGRIAHELAERRTFDFLKSRASFADAAAE